MQNPGALPVLADMRFVSWLDLALSALLPHWQGLADRVIVRLMDLRDNQAWWGITLNGRWLRGNNGAVTVFDSLLAADRFLHLLKINRFMIGNQVESVLFIDEQDQEVFIQGERCTRCDRTTCGIVPGQEISPCSQLTERRRSMSGHAHPAQDATDSPILQAVA